MLFNCFPSDGAIKKEHSPIEPCLNYEGKWRNVCLSCGRVEIDGQWKTLRELN